MAQLQNFSTEHVHPEERIRFWHTVTCDALAPQIARPVDRTSFRGRMTRLDLDGLRLVEVCASGSVVRCARAALTSARTVYLARIALSGQVTLMQGGREARLGPGDFTLCDAGRPYQLSFCGTPRVLIIRVTRDEMLRYVSRPESLLAIPMSGRVGLSGLASRHVRELWRMSGAFVENGATDRMADICMHLISSAYSGISRVKVEQSCLLAAHRASVIEFIERNLASPHLTPSAIARAFTITPSYLHRIFAQEPWTVSRYIMNRRLQECARALKVLPLQRSRTITSVAADFGFNSVAHFSRVFRQRYGVSPKEYRSTPIGCSLPDNVFTDGQAQRGSAG